MIISVMGRKGGITKTTLAKHLAGALALQGLRVLLVDADGQGNASDGVGVARHDGMYKLIMQGADWVDVLVPVGDGFAGVPFWLLSSADLQRQVESWSETPSTILERFDEVRASFDVVLVDTSPGITEVHTGFYFASDWVLLPTLMEFDSIRSLDTMFEYLGRAEAQGKGAGIDVAQVLGIVPNRMDARQKTHQVNYGWLRGAFRQVPVFKPLRDLAVWQQANQVGKCITHYEAEDYASRMSARKAWRELSPVIEAVMSKVGGSI